MTVEINGVPYEYFNTSPWVTSELPGKLSGDLVINRQRQLTLNAEIMPMTEYNTLTPLNGQIVSVKVCGYDVAGDVTYYGVAVKGVSGVPVGLNMTNVAVSLRIGDV